MSYLSAWKDESVIALQDVASRFVKQEVMTNLDKWEQQQFVDRDVWTKAASLGLLCCSMPEEYGGGGGTIAHDLAVVEAQGAQGDFGWGNIVHSGIVAHYIAAYGTEEQKREWLPPMCDGSVIGAIAMTEPDTGSDLQAVRTKAVAQGDQLLIDGSKTFISNGHLADLVIVVAKTDPSARASGISLILVDTRDAPGFSRGRILNKIGQHAADTSELHFSGVTVPASSVLGGEPGKGFEQLMSQLAQERLFIGVVAVAAMETALRLTVQYTKNRRAFDQTLFDFQNTRFELAEVATSTHIARVFLDSCIERHLAGELDATTAAMSKWWLTEQQMMVMDKCLQLHGGNGYMREYPIARMYEDARAQKIYGGTNEIMKELVSRSL